MALWDDKTERAVRKSFADAKAKDREAMAESFDVAIEYSRGKMLRDTEGLLVEMYPNRQQSPNHRIRAVTLPLVKYYLDEMATPYCSGVTRRVIDEKGTESEELTKQLNDALEEIGYNDILKQVDRRLVLLRSCGVLFTAENGVLDVQIIDPQNIWPIAPERIYNPANQDSYEGFCVDSRLHVRDLGDRLKTYTLFKPEGTLTYTGPSPDRIRETLADTANPFSWPLPAVSAKGKPVGVKDRQLQMLTIWHDELPVDELLPTAEPPIWIANRQINAQWSVLHDIFRFQSGATPFKSVANPSSEPSEQAIGVHFPQILRPGEAFGYATAGNDYTGLVAFLQNFVRVVGLMHRMAPSDLATEGPSPQSGFAKLIESLPKIRAQEDRVRQLVRGEMRAWPRLASILIWLGMLDKSATAHKLRVEFDRVKIPQSVDERTREEDHDIKHGLTSAAQIYADRHGVSLEEAEERIAENKGRSGAPTAEGPAPGQLPSPVNRGPGLLARLVAQKESPKEADEDA